MSINSMSRSSILHGEQDHTCSIYVTNPATVITTHIYRSTCEVQRYDLIVHTAYLSCTCYLHKHLGYELHPTPRPKSGAKIAEKSHAASGNESGKEVVHRLGRMPR